jgi:hypothetical protein
LGYYDFLKQPKLTCKRQQTHKSCPLNRQLDFSLAACTVSAAFTRENLAPMGEQFAQNFYIFVIDILGFRPAKPALILLADIFSAFFLFVWLVRPFLKALTSH